MGILVLAYEFTSRKSDLKLKLCVIKSELQDINSLLREKSQNCEFI